MSGGHWDYYVQHRLTEVIETINSIIEKNGKEKTIDEMKDESYGGLDYYEKYLENKLHYKYPDEVIEEFKKGLKIISDAQIYIRRIDYLICGDDGNETFLERLHEELKKT